MTDKLCDGLNDELSEAIDRQREIYEQALEEAIKNTIRICKSKNILKEYLTENETEVMDIMRRMYSFEKAIDAYIESEERDLPYV